MKHKVKKRVLKSLNFIVNWGVSLGATRGATRFLRVLTQVISEYISLYLYATLILFYFRSFCQQAMCYTLCSEPSMFLSVIYLGGPSTSVH